MPSDLPSRAPTAAHKACIAELLLRFPCPRDTDPDDYQARAELLTKDVAALQPGLLRKACDRVALSTRGLPYAAEILEAARQIVAERQAAQAAESRANGERTAVNGGLVQTLLERNRLLAERNAGHRWVIRDGKATDVTVRQWGGEPDKVWRCLGNGRVGRRVWDDATRTWKTDELAEGVVA